jgi:TonB family protein
VTAFESLTGDLPFKGDSVASMLLHIVQDPPTIPASLSPALASVFCRAFEKAPGQRYPDVNTFTGALIHAVPLGSSVRTKLLLMLAGEDVSLHGFVPVSTHQWAVPSDSGGVPPVRTPTPTPVVALPSEPDSSGPTALARPSAPPARPTPAARAPLAPLPRPSNSVFSEAPAEAPRRSRLPLVLVVGGVLGTTVLGLVGAGTWIARRRAASAAPAAPASPSTEPAPPEPAVSPAAAGNPPAEVQGNAQLQEELKRLQAANARDAARLLKAGKPGPTATAAPVAAAPAPVSPAPAPVQAPAPAPATPEPLHNQGVQVLQQAPAAFPPAALGNPLYTLREPRVRLRVFVSETGIPLQVMVASGVGRAGFDEAAIAAARRSRFAPAVQGGKAVGAWTELTYTFKAGR